MNNLTIKQAAERSKKSGSIIAHWKWSTTAVSGPWKRMRWRFWQMRGLWGAWPWRSRDAGRSASRTKPVWSKKSAKASSGWWCWRTGWASTVRKRMIISWARQRRDLVFSSLSLNNPATLTGTSKAMILIQLCIDAAKMLEVVQYKLSKEFRKTRMERCADFIYVCKLLDLDIDKVNE